MGAAPPFAGHGESPRALRVSDALLSGVAAASAAIGCLVLAGWVFDNVWLKRIHPSLLPMRPNLAASFILAGFALWTRRRQARPGPGRRMGTACAALVVAIGAITLAEYVIGRDLGIDAILVGTAAGATEPLRMGVAAALNAMLVGIAIVLIDVKIRGAHQPSQWLGLVTIFVSVVNALGYLYGVTALSSWGPHPPIAVHAVATFFLLGIAVVAADPHGGLMRPITSDAAPGLLSRRILPAALVLPILLGWLQLVGHRAHLYPALLGLAIYATANVVFLVALVWWTAAALEKLELKRRGAARALAESERSLAATLENVADGVLTIDADGRVTTLNAAAETLMRWSRSAVVGRPLRELVAAAGALPDFPLEVILAGKAVDRQDLVVRSEQAAGVLWLNISARPLGAGGRRAGAVIAFRDVTADRAGQASQMAADRMASLGLLAAALAHEINNPLAAVLAGIELAVGHLSRLPPALLAAHPPALIEDLATARTGAERVRQIVRDLKIFSREDGSELVPVDVNAALETSLRLAGNEIRHRARLHQRLEAVPPVDATEGRVGQVFLNLLVNAAQAIPEGHRDDNEIRVRSFTGSAGRVIVEIADTGPGIPHASRERLFTPFFTTKTVGTGLGLSICKRIVSSLGGDIEVDSELGRGAVFRVSLPASRRATAPVAASPAQPTPASAPAARGRVLLIDDEEMVRKVVARALEREHHVVVCASADEALRKIESGECFDVILCDLMMPVVTGYELHERIAHVAPDQADRMVFMTGGAFSERARDFLDQRPGRWLAKPFNLDAVRTIVAQFTKTKEKASPDEERR